MTNHMALDQFGTTEHDLGPHPRKELLARYGRKHTDRIYVDGQDGSVVPVGYIVAGRWFRVFKIQDTP